MTKFKKQKRSSVQISKKIQRVVDSLLRISDNKFWWSCKTLSVLSKSILKTRSIFIKFLTKVVWKLENKKSEFQKLYVRRSDNRKHSFFITWIFYQLTDLWWNYAIQLNQKSDICEVLEKLAIKMWFLFIFAKKLKDLYFVVGRSKNLKLSPKFFFGISFQKNVWSSFLLFLSVCY